VICGRETSRGSLSRYGAGARAVVRLTPPATEDGPSAYRRLDDVTAAAMPSSRVVRSLCDDHPPDPLEEGVDVRCPPFPRAAIDFNRNYLPTSFAASAVNDYFNIRVTGETLLHGLVRLLWLTTRNDKQIPPHSPQT